MLVQIATALSSALVVALLAIPGVAAAASFEVTRTDDPVPDACAPGDCSLREALRAAAAEPGDDEVLLRSRGPYELALAPLAAGGEEGDGLGGDLDVEGGGVRIVRAGAGEATIDANGLDRVLEVSDGDSLALARITLTGGRSEGAGGAILARGGLGLRRVTVRGNAAADGGGALALLAGTARVRSSTLNDNQAARGGAVAVERGARLVAINSTLAGNRSNAGGGAIAAAGAVTLNAATIAYNVADFDLDGTGAGGGVLAEPGAFVVENSLLARNRRGTGERSDCAGNFDSDGDNVIGALDPAGCTGLDFAGDVLLAGKSPRIGRLRDNGGATRTIALRRNSPALDEAGVQSSPRRDQRDVKRDELPDIGAYERVSARRR